VSIISLALVVYGVAMTVGYLLNRFLRLPWMFTTVILGMTLTAAGLFQDVLAGPEFAILTRMGMLLFLFTVGLELDLAQVRHLGRHIVGGNILMTLTEGLILGLFFYFVIPAAVGHSFLVALVAGVSFGTVGEVVLLAIMKEFKVENTRFGQLALGIGVFDDVFEILTLAIVVALPAIMGISGENAWATSGTILLTLVGIIAATILVSRAAKPIRAVLARLPGDSFVAPFFVFFLLFGFIYFGSTRFENLGIVAAILAGIAVKQVLPPPMLQQYKRPLFFVANIFLGPFFFLGLGAHMSFDALAQSPWLVAAVVVISLTVRIALSFGLFSRLLGKRESVVMGIGLTSKFSTSVITENLLLTAGLITPMLYSVIMGAFIVLKPLIVAGFSRGVATVVAPAASQAMAHEAQSSGVPVLEPAE
jgi:Kef-type K+ transport system membrane component KefB